jgi:hypothetical protein
VNARNTKRFGQTPLHLAALKVCFSNWEQERDSHSVVCYSFLKGNLNVAKFLISRKADVHAVVDNVRNGRSVLDMAIIGKNNQLCAELIDLGVILTTETWACTFRRKVKT